MARDVVSAASQIVADACQIRRFVFVAGAGRVVTPGGRCGHGVALRIAGYASVQIGAVRSDLHKPRILHFAQLRPSHEIVATEVANAVRHAGFRRHPDPIGDHCHHSRNAVGAQYRERAGIDAAQAVVEGQQHRFFRQWSIAARRAHHFVQRYRAVARCDQPVDLCDEIGGADGVAVGVALGRDVVADVVIADDQQVVVAGLRGMRRERRQCGQRQRETPDDDCECHVILPR